MKLVSDKYRFRTLILTATEKRKKHEQFERTQVKVLQVPADEFGWIDLEKAMIALAKYGITSVYVEGGGQLAGSLLSCSLIDEFQILIAPKILGEGLSSFAGVMKSMDQAYLLEWEAPQKVGADVLITGKPR
jgi:diaminohydroxyphosphoribosylaminopyrimidine deaminase/5-amino-6-(5-phosphoribosylamino)uracil reductase